MEMRDSVAMAGNYFGKRINRQNEKRTQSAGSIKHSEREKSGYKLTSKM